MRAYHDREWGVPLHNDRALFELLTLEGAQAGLSWRTVLHRRQGYREVFDGFDLERIAAYTPADIEARRADPRIIRNRAKIQATVGNAQAALRAIGELGSLDALVWSFVDGHPLRNAFQSMDDPPSRNRGFPRLEPRPQTPRLQIRRPHHLLRLHAGRRPGQRPSRDLLPLPGGLTSAFSAIRL